nr:MAG TPA: hypothetical protein [Caudoviricetes sp.]
MATASPRAVPSRPRGQRAVLDMSPAHRLPRPRRDARLMGARPRPRRGALPAARVRPREHNARPLLVQPQQGRPRPRADGAVVPQLVAALGRGVEISVH